MKLFETVRSSTLIKKGGITLFFRLVGIGLSYALSLLIARLYGPTVFGFFALSQMVLMVGGSIAKGGVDLSFLQLSSSLPLAEQKQQLKSDYRRSFLIILLFGSILTGLGWWFMPFIAEKVFQNPGVTPYLRISVFGILPYALYRLNGEGLRSRTQVGKYVALDRIWPFGLTIAAIGATYSFVQDPTWLFWSYILSIFFTFLLSAWWWEKSVSFSLTKSENRHSFGELVKRGFPMMISGMLFLIMGWTDQFIIAMNQSEIEVGYYHMALKISNLTALALFAVNAISAPKMAESFGKKDKKGLQKIVTDSANLVFAMVIPVSIFLALFGNYLLNLFGEGFTEAYWVLLILVGGQMVNSLSGSVMYILQMTKNQVIGQYILMGAAAANLVLNILLVPTYGIEGAAVATAISTAVWNLTSILVIKKRLQILAIARPSKILKSFNYLRRGNRSKR